MRMYFLHFCRHWQLVLDQLHHRWYQRRNCKQVSSQSGPISKVSILKLNRFESTFPAYFSYAFRSCQKFECCFFAWKFSSKQESFLFECPLNRFCLQGDFCTNCKKKDQDVRRLLQHWLVVTSEDHYLVISFAALIFSSSCLRMCISKWHDLFVFKPTQPQIKHWVFSLFVGIVCLISSKYWSVTLCCCFRCLTRLDLSWYLCSLHWGIGHAGLLSATPWSWK